MEIIQITTSAQTSMIDMTDRIQEVISRNRFTHGLCYLFIPHTTAAITINEHADPDVKADLLAELNKLIPFDDHYRHLEGNSAAHIKASLVGSSLTVYVEGGRLHLGTWQGIFFCEFDGPRTRQVWVHLLTA